VEDLGDTICVEHKKPVSSSQPSKEQTNVSAVPAQEGQEPPPTMSSRKNSSHVLTRQGAMEAIDYIFHALTLSMLRDRHFRVTRNKTLMACYLGIPGNVRHRRSHTV
jgi:hypothetical protein